MTMEDFIKFAQANEPRILGRQEDYEEPPESRLAWMEEYCHNELKHIPDSIARVKKEYDQECAKPYTERNIFVVEGLQGEMSFYEGYQAALKSVLEK